MKKRIGELASNPGKQKPVGEKLSKKNPKWSRDELILALDLYIRLSGKTWTKDSPAVIELSQLLNRLGLLLGRRGNGTFRNSNGVYMKLMNFRRLDPKFQAAGKKGLSRGNRDEAEVWMKFSGNSDHLNLVALFIRNEIHENTIGKHPLEFIESEIEEAEEGQVATRIHQYRERDRRLVDAAKSRALKRDGKLCCAACGFNFVERYGSVANGVIEVHHTKPVHTMQPGEKTKVSDLVLLCSNCHRVVHSKRNWITIEFLKALLKDVTPLRS